MCGVKNLRCRDPDKQRGGAAPGAGPGFQEAGAEEGRDGPGPEGLLLGGGTWHSASSVTVLPSPKVCKVLD